MGNCLALEDKVIRVMKTDGKILEYQAPIKVQQVLSDYSGHALSDSFSGFRNLQPDGKLLPGLLYYLIPLPSPSRKSPGVVRIKLILSKKELQELVEKGVSVHDMASHLQSKQSTKGVDMSDGDEDKCIRRWKPELESIAEVN
ncbi:hypothetical protein V6N13_010367 [Hibiscus sabdariffa]